MVYYVNMAKTMIRDFVNTIEQRLRESTPLIQVVLGPRQVGKTTGIKQLLKKIKGHHIYASADDMIAPGRVWLLEKWQSALFQGEDTILVIDEVQKIPNWSEIIKKLWDNQEKGQIKLVLLGSSSLLLQKGLTESLAGRYELIMAYHWNYAESKKAFGYSLEEYLTFGGYPGADPFKDDFQRWSSYIKNSIIEAVIGRDILNFRHVAKPALFRQAFEILCYYPAQEISYSKLLGQLQDKGNTDLVKYYLELYEGAFLFKVLPKYSQTAYKKKSSSPKILPSCPALYTMTQDANIIKDPTRKGRVFELAVGNVLSRLPGKLYYWRENNAEVDYIYAFGNELFAIEVKSGINKTSKGLLEFAKKYPNAKQILIDYTMFEKFDADPMLFLTKLSFHNELL